MSSSILQHGKSFEFIELKPKIKNNTLIIYLRVVLTNKYLLEIREKKMTQIVLYK